MKLLNIIGIAFKLIGAMFIITITLLLIPLLMVYEYFYIRWYNREGRFIGRKFKVLKS